MLRNPLYVLEDVAEVKALIRAHPWATIVAAPGDPTSSGAPQLVASHYPMLVEDTEDQTISLLSHVGRPDDRTLGLGDGREVLVILQGPHGYISPNWYPEEQFIPTWNHATVHLWGVPQVLDEEENYRVLSSLVDHFEAPMPHPRSLAMNPELSRRVARGTVGFRLVATRMEARMKLSQTKEPQVRRSVIDGLSSDPTYGQPELAALMERRADPAPPSPPDVAAPSQ